MRAGGTALACLVALAGMAQAAETVTLNYELSTAGLGAADVQVTAKIDSTTFDITATGQTHGAADLFGSLVLDARSSSVVQDGRVTASWFSTDNIYKGYQRYTRVAWSGREGKTTAIWPTLDMEERSPIPDDARMDALDPIAALLSFAYGEPSQGRCSGTVKVFDGRRSYTLSLDNSDGGGAWQTVEIGGQEITALRCTVISDRTGGKSPGGLFSSSRTRETGALWFWKDGKGRAIPVRLEADAPIGTGVVELSALPSP